MKRVLLLTVMVLTVCIAALGQRKFPKVSVADFATPAEVNPNGGMADKYCYWFNAKYVKSIVEQMMRQG